MRYLLYFNKFEIDFEKLKSKLGKIIEFSKEKAIVETDLKELLNLEEIDHIIELKTDFKPFSFIELKKDALKFVQNKKYFIKLDFLSKIPISGKSIYKHINPYLKHEGFNVDEDYNTLLHIELIKLNGKAFYRLGISNKNMYEKQNPLNIDLSNFVVVLEEPASPLEMKDFLRVCWIFKLPLYILSKNELAAEELLNSSLKKVHGVSPTLLEIKIINKIPSNFTKIGFTKHSLKNEKDLKKILNKDKKYALIFGNEKFGLSQELRDKLDFSIHLGPKTEKPFRGSQALSYVLGIIPNLS